MSVCLLTTKLTLVSFIFTLEVHGAIASDGIWDRE